MKMEKHNIPKLMGHDKIDTKRNSIAINADRKNQERSQSTG